MNTERTGRQRCAAIDFLEDLQRKSDTVPVDDSEALLR
jgi:hypothetical protein